MQSLAVAPSARLAGARASSAQKQQQQARPAVVAAARASSKRSSDDSAPTPVAVAPALAAFAAAAVLVRFDLDGCESMRSVTFVLALVRALSLSKSRFCFWNRRKEEEEQASLIVNRNALIFARSLRAFISRRARCIPVHFVGFNAERAKEGSE